MVAAILTFLVDVLLMENVHLPYAVPSAWNSLPDELRDASFSVSVFRSKLKSHLFADYIECILEVSERLIRCINSHSHIGLSISYKA